MNEEISLLHYKIKLLEEELIGKDNLIKELKVENRKLKLSYDGWEGYDEDKKRYSKP